jgi:hypothetical protein
MITIDGRLARMSLCGVLPPAFLMHINGTFGAVINMGPGFFTTDRTFHDLLPSPPFAFLLSPSGLAIFPFSSLESVT